MKLTIAALVLPVLICGAAVCDEDVYKAELKLGYSAIDIDGNIYRAEQYEVLKEGPFPARLDISRDRPDAERWRLSYKFNGENDLDFDLQWLNQYRDPSFDIYFRDYKFYRQTLSGSGIRNWGPYESNRREFGAETRITLEDHVPTFLSFRRVNVDGPGDPFALLFPAGPHYKLDEFELSRSCNFGSKLRLDYLGTYSTFEEYTGRAPFSTMSAHQLAFAYTAGDNTLLSAGYSYAKQKQDGFGSATKYQRWYVGAESFLGSGLFLSGKYSLFKLTNDVTRTAITREDRRGELAAAYSFAPNFNIRAGYRHDGFDELNRAQSATYKPKRDVYWVSSSYRPTKGLSFRAKIRHQKVGSLVDDPDGVVADKRTEHELRLQYKPDSTVNVSLTSGRDKRKNTLDGFEYKVERFGGALWWYAADSAAFSAEYMKYNWKSNVALATGFLSDAEVFSASAWFAVSKKVRANVGYTIAKSSDSANVEDKALTVGLTAKLRPDWEYTLQYRSRDFDDNVTAANTYDADVISLWCTKRY